MASYSAVRAAHATLVATTVDTVTLTGSYARVEVRNRSTGDIFLTLDGSTPTVAGNETLVVPANSVGSFPNVAGISAPVTVKLISSGTPAYSVTGA